jgi:hypothetical protein
MLLKPFDPFKKEMQEKESIDYLGSIEDNNDPLKLGRVRVRIPIYEDLETTALPWCAPELSSFLGNSQNSICFSVPEIGSQVHVYFPTQDIYHPTYRGADLTENNTSTFFHQNYPNSYGIKDSKGNFVRIDKTDETMQIQHGTSTNILFKKDGSYIVTQANGSFFEMNPAGMVRTNCTNMEANVEEKVTFNCKNFEINAEEKISMNCNELNIKATDLVDITTTIYNILSLNTNITATDVLYALTPLLNASGHVNDYKSTMDDMRNIYDSHTHVGVHGNTSPPSPLM